MSLPRFCKKHLVIAVYDTDRARVLSRIPDTDFVYVTDAEGKRVYMTLKEEEDMEREVSDNLVFAQSYCTAVVIA